jgi:hypothetical protein
MLEITFISIERILKVFVKFCNLSNDIFDE